MWIWDGNKHFRLREEDGVKNRNDFICHEVWEKNGDFIFYHGRYMNGVCFLGRVDPEGKKSIEIEFPLEYKREGHFIPGKNGFFVTDGFYEDRGLPERIRLKLKRTFKKETSFCGRYLTLVKADWNERRINWYPICRHGSDWSDQSCHPHPLLDNHGRRVYFNSNRKGKNAIYSAAIAAPLLDE